jgi:hypothetical protein
MKKTALLLLMSMPVLVLAQSLIVTAPDQTVRTNEPLQFQLGVDNSTAGDKITFSAGSLPEGAKLDTNSGSFNWKPTTKQAGLYSLTFYARSQSDRQGSKSVAVNVISYNHPPVFYPIGGKSVSNGASLEFFIRAKDDDGDSLYYSARNSPPDAKFDENSGKFSWTPQNIRNNSKRTVVFTVNDMQGGSDTEKVEIKISDAQYPPRFVHGFENQSINEGERLAFEAQVNDPNGIGPRVFADSGKPRDMRIGKENGLIEWTPGYNFANEHDTIFGFKLMVSDSTNLQDTITITIKVADKPDKVLMKQKFDNAVKGHQDLVLRMQNDEKKARPTYKHRKNRRQGLEWAAAVIGGIGIVGQALKQDESREVSAQIGTIGAGLLGLTAKFFPSPEDPLKLLTGITNLQKENDRAYEKYIAPWPANPEHYLTDKKFGECLEKYNEKLDEIKEKLDELERNELLLSK